MQHSFYSHSKMSLAHMTTEKRDALCDVTKSSVSCTLRRGILGGGCKRRAKCTVLLLENESWCPPGGHQGVLDGKWGCNTI